MKMSVVNFDQNSGWSHNLSNFLDSETTLIIVFGSTCFFKQTNPFDDLSQHFRLSKIIGCSTAGEISGQTITDNSLVVGIIDFEKTDLKTASIRILDGFHSFDAGAEIANQLNDKHLRGVLIFSEGLNVNGSQLISGVNSVLPDSVVVTGGLAGDGDKFQKTWVLKNGYPESDFVSAVGFYGDHVKIGHGSKGGWDIFGPERRVTKSTNNVLYEIDGKPALELYKSYLGERATELPASALLFPLALRANSTDENQIVRTILGVNEANQSMTFAGDLPENSLVQLMRANFDRLIDGAAEAALMTGNKTFNQTNDVFSIVISCVGRRLILGERAEEELEAVAEFLPPNTKQIGFYSYGEISPFSIGHCELHNQTMTITTITEN
jgi:hypothetical protein